MREQSHNQDMENDSPDRDSPEYWDAENDYNLPEDGDDLPEPECECYYISEDEMETYDCPVHGDAHRKAYVYPVTQMTPFDDSDVAF